MNAVVGTPGFIDPYMLKTVRHTGLAQMNRPFKMKNELSQYQGQKITDVLEVSDILKGDVFALGCVFFQLATGVPYFDHTSNEEMLQVGEKYVLNEYFLKCRVSHALSIEAVDLLEKMLQENPMNRASAKQCLDHCWLTPPSMVQPL